MFDITMELQHNGYKPSQRLHEVEMAYDFPSSPSVGQAYDKYVWDGEKWTWTVVGGSGGVSAPGNVDFTNVGNPMLVAVLEDF